jgi:hypothetical protein
MLNVNFGVHFGTNSFWAIVFVVNIQLDLTSLISHA